MKNSLHLAAALALMSLSGHGFAQTDAEGHPHATAPANPYAGQQARAIKSLSESEIAALLAGKGAGFAKAAELNGYPGPAHVLELAEPLNLDGVQLAATQQLMAAHQSRAKQLGAEAVEAERALDSLFAHKHADAKAVSQATQRIGALQARIRAEHLNTHLTQTALLSPDQVLHYGVLRGYAAAAVSNHGPQAPAASHQH
ncbi:MAG: periplasmic heavy metal sensor [Burkholderiaceae bacterium]|nr:periplasmic heavy metal sensor [Burkholderiaceae bacterium]